MMNYKCIYILWLFLSEVIEIVEDLTLIVDNWNRKLLDQSGGDDMWMQIDEEGK